jgi:predicted molibdopterin-dependent oxidoreductase YjgC
VREEGRLVGCSRDEAMGRVVERSRAPLDERGPGSIGFYTSRQLFLEEYYTLMLIARAGIGTNHLDGNTRLCTQDGSSRPRTRSPYRRVPHAISGTRAK